MLHTRNCLSRQSWKHPHRFRTKFSDIVRNSKPKPTPHITFSLTERFWWAFTKSNNNRLFRNSNLFLLFILRWLSSRTHWNPAASRPKCIPSMGMQISNTALPSNWIIPFHFSWWLQVCCHHLVLVARKILKAAGQILCKVEIFIWYM